MTSRRRAAATASRRRTRVRRLRGRARCLTVRGRSAEPAPTSRSRPTVDWHERQKLLKLAFPLDVHADRAAVGDPVRPRLPAHAHQHVVGRGPVRDLRAPLGARGRARLRRRASPTTRPTATTSRRTDPTTAGPPPTVRLSLLRAPLFPDPEADQGGTRFRTSLVPGADIPDAVRERLRLNLPRAGPRWPAVARWSRVDNPAVVVEAVKLADDRSGDVIVRSTRPSAAGRRPRSAPASASRAYRPRTCWSATWTGSGWAAG